MRDNLRYSLGNMDFNNLPEDLSKKELTEYLLLSSKGNFEARDKIIIHNLRLVKLIVFNFYDPIITKEDMFSTGILGLIKAIDTYKREMKSSFSTYASVCIRNEIITLLRNKQKSKKEVSLEDIISYDRNGNNLRYRDILSEEDTEILNGLIIETDKETLRKCFLKLSDKEKEVIFLLYGFYDSKIFTQKEIAEKLNLTQSMISKIKTKVLRLLKVEFEKRENDLEMKK